jgi:predicted glutamine amidotransferase
MCRFTLYLGPPVRLATLLTEPGHSLIHQSFHSRERSEPLNGDGFGIGWYAPRLTPEPALFHQITPAWSNRSLLSMSRVVASPCVLAHVRAATPGSDVNLANCHPFGFGRYLLMHNGHIGSFREIRRRLLHGLTDEAFNVIRGSTDTEHLFAVFVDELVRNGHPSNAAAGNGAQGDVALELTRRLSAALARVLAFSHDEGQESSFLNVAVADGSRAAVARFTDDDTEQPESLYYLEGEMYEPAGRRFTDQRSEDDGLPVVVSSERLTEDDRWVAVPPNHIMVLDRMSPPRILALDVDARIVA